MVPRGGGLGHRHACITLLTPITPRFPLPFPSCPPSNPALHPPPTTPGCDLQHSQLNKIDALIAKAGITAEHHVLEVGCGWGSFAIRAAASTGCRVTGLTLSKEQLAEATARVKAAGLGDRVTLLFCDYRDCPGAGSYDRVVSCEMIEAVGQEHLVAYFRTLGSMLRPGGTAVLQVIAEPDERYESYCASSDFIREHIFPGGHLPSMGAMVEAARGTGLTGGWARGAGARRHAP